MDDLDRAQELEMASRNAAIAAQRNTHKTLTYSHCVDCGDAIPQERRAIGGVQRCLDCQIYVERLTKTKRNNHGR